MSRKYRTEEGRDGANDEFIRSAERLALEGILLTPGEEKECMDRFVTAYNSKRAELKKCFRFAK